MKKKILAGALAFVTAFSVLTGVNVKNANALTGWSNQNGSWYYYNGNMQTGWQQVNETWYYFYNSGEMATGWINHLNGWYYLSGSGSMVTGWLHHNNDWYYLNEGGAMVKGWLHNNNAWYYMNNNGAMAVDTVIDTEYRILGDGRWDGEKVKQLNYNEAYKLFSRALEKLNNETPDCIWHLDLVEEWIFPYSSASDYYFKMENKWELVNTKLWTFILEAEDGIEFRLYVDYKGRVYGAGDGCGGHLIDLN